MSDTCNGTDLHYLQAGLMPCFFIFLSAKETGLSNRGLKNQVEQLLLTVTVNKERCFSFSQKWVEDQSD